MGSNVHPVARWSLIAALGIAVLMVVYYIATQGSGNSGQIAFGMAVVALATAAFIYLFYSRMNTVQRTGNMALFFVVLVALLLPFFFLSASKTNADAAKVQYDKQLSYAAGKYVTYCSTCHGLLGQGLSGPKLQGNKALEKLNIAAIITGGIPDNADPSQYLMPAWSDQNGGPFNADDIAAMTAFVESWDPVLQVKNNVPTTTNGFDLIFAQLDPATQKTYLAQKAAANGPADAPIDLTALKTVTIPIVKDPNSTNGVSWNFLYPVPNGAPTRVIKVKSGTVVQWQNESGLAHSVYSGTPGSNTNYFAIPIVNDGTTTVAVTMPTVTKETVVSYYCSFHPAMVAEILVEP